MTQDALKKGGRPSNYDGDIDPILAIFNKHLGGLIRKKRNGSVFADAGTPSSPKLDKLRPYLDFHLEMANHQSNWAFRRAIPGGGLEAMEPVREPCAVEGQHGLVAH